jgi:hypothetical protein
LLLLLLLQVLMHPMPRAARWNAQLSPYLLQVNDQLLLQPQAVLLSVVRALHVIRAVLQEVRMYRFCCCCSRHAHLSYLDLRQWITTGLDIHSSNHLGCFLLRLVFALRVFQKLASEHRMLWYLLMDVVWVVCPAEWSGVCGREPPAASAVGQNRCAELHQPQRVV